MNLLRAIFESLLGSGWKDPIPPDLDPPLQNLRADCLRPTGDHLKKRHWYGRAGSPASPSTACLRCGTPNPYKRPTVEEEA